MKMKPEHFDKLKTSIVPLDTPTIRGIYQRREIPRPERVKDIDMRYRWDLFTAAGFRNGMINELYQYLDDTHIDTALRAIVKPLDPA